MERLDPPDAINSIPFPGEDPRPYLLDLHVLDSERLPDGWFDQCMRSILHAVLRAPYRTEIHVHDEVVGDEWAARRAAYALGSAPYVCHVDMDDWLAEDALAYMASWLAAGVPVVGTNGIGFDLGNDGARVDLSEGLVALKREFLDQIDWSNPDNRCCPMHAMRDVAGPVRWVPERGLFRRIGYDSLGAKQRRMKESQHAVG